MEKLIFSGTCLETNQKLTGSLIQFEDGTCTIAFKEADDKKYTSPVIPESVECVSHLFIPKKSYTRLLRGLLALKS